MSPHLSLANMFCLLAFLIALAIAAPLVDLSDRQSATATPACTSPIPAPSKSFFPEYTYLHHPLYNGNEYNIRRGIHDRVAVEAAPGTGGEATPSPPMPVVMQKYYLGVRRLTDRFLTFALGKTFKTNGTNLTYEKPGETPEGSSTLHFQDLDCLVAKPYHHKEKPTDYFNMKLNYRARVIVLLYGSNIRSNIFPFTPGALTLNMSEEAKAADSRTWENPTVVKRAATSLKTWSGRRINFKFPDYAVAVETHVEKGENFNVPDPSHFRLKGTRSASPQRMVVFFAQPEDPANGGRITPFSYPQLPAFDRVRKLNPNIKIEKITLPDPNERCPDWLHDIHVVRNRNMSNVVAYNEEMYWRTWHPMIDPVYWCYYDHEHGAYPGLYRPPFGYTARKTYDEAVEDENGNTIVPRQPQDESHNGFKVFSFTTKKRRVVVVTMHAHVSRPRRFTARFHTVMFDVFDFKDEEDEWIETMNLKMKMDFGFVQLNRRTSSGDQEEKVRPSDIDIKQNFTKDFRPKIRVARLRFNVYTILSEEARNFTRDQKGQVDKKFMMNTFPSSVFVGDKYEKWDGPLNTCMSTGRFFEKGIDMDIRDAATAMVDPNYGIEGVDQLFVPGESIKRVISFVESAVEIDACKFMDLRKATGLESELVSCTLEDVNKLKELDEFKGDDTKTVREKLFMSSANFRTRLENYGGKFYTDPFFGCIKQGPGLEAVEQYIDPEFRKLSLSDGKNMPKDYWNSELISIREAKEACEDATELDPLNLEGASRKTQN